MLLGIFCLREFGGQGIVFFYTVYLFEATKSSIDPFTCTLIVGITRLVFTCTAALIIDRVGRKFLLLSTVITCALTLSTAAASMMITSENSFSSWISLVSVLLFVAAYGIGVGPVPWILLGELLPSPIRSLGASIITTWFSVIVFGVSNIFPNLMTVIGYEGGFIIFAICNMILAFIVWKWLPETQGQSLLLLEAAFSKDEPQSKDKSSC